MNDVLNILSSATEAKLSMGEHDKFDMLYENPSKLDHSRSVLYYFEDLPKPENKDQQRIYDIVKKSQNEVFFLRDRKLNLIARADEVKMKALADVMNNRIKDENKRAARREACKHYGLNFLAECFTKENI